MSLRKLMLLVLTGALVIGLAFTSGCATEETGTATQAIEDVSAQEAFTLIQDNQNNPDFVIIDVRTPEEYAAGHIEGAINMDFYSATFRDELDSLDKNKTYLIYCRSGARSQNSAKIMEELNFSKVYNMLGGFLAWNAEGLPTIK